MSPLLVCSFALAVVLDPLGKSIQSSALAVILLPTPVVATWDVTANVTPTPETEMLPEVVTAREILTLFEAELTKSMFPNSKVPESTWNCKSESALNATENGAI